MSLIDEFVNGYIAPNGGGKAELWDETDGLYPGASRRAINENSILFLVQPALELDPEGKDPRIANAYCRFTDAATIDTGLYGRWPGHMPGKYDYIGQSHDNVVCHSIGSWLYNTKHAAQICDYGEEHWFSYNVKKLGKFDIKQWLQPGDWAIVRLAAKRNPGLIPSIWLAVGLSITKNWNLADVRVQFLNKVKIPWYYRWIIMFGVRRYESRSIPRAMWVKSFYRDDGNPFKKKLLTD